MKIFSIPQVRQWDAFTIAHEPVSSINLMERAATACFNWLTNKFGRSKDYIVFCGTGNNGGDGLAIARMLHDGGYAVSVYILEGGNSSDDFTTNLQRITSQLQCRHIFSTVDFEPTLNDSVIIDALFGSGLSRPLDGVAADLVAYINQSGKTIVSIDIPTGLFASAHSEGLAIIRACDTLSFQMMKLAFMMAENNQFTGNIHLLDIGLHPKFYQDEMAAFNTIDAGLINTIYKPRNQFTHKYNFGHALLYAGSKNMMGASILCAKACLRSGAGLVTIYTEENTQGVIQTALPEAITSMEVDFKMLSGKKRAIGIGPGLTASAENEVILKQVIEDYHGPVVIDATALQMLSANTRILTHRKTHPAILTPHTGEFEKLFGKTSDDFETATLAMRQSAELGCYIVLKGHHTLIACPDGNAYFNTTGNAGMATAGSGDVLTGIITGLLAQGYSPESACLMGVYFHGMAGDIAAEKMTQEAMIAGDIIDCMGEAYKQIRCNLGDIS